MIMVHAALTFDVVRKFRCHNDPGFVTRRLGKDVCEAQLGDLQIEPKKVMPMPHRNLNTR